MSIPPEGPEVGQCYLTEDGRVRKVMRLLPDGRIRYRYRGPLSKRWRSGTLDHRSFVSTIERPVPCDWTPENDASRTGKSDQ
jgi:hypothetical protein